MPSRFVSVLDKRRQENKQHDESVIEGKDNEDLICTTSPVPLLQEICSDKTENFNTDTEE